MGTVDLLVILIFHLFIVFTHTIGFKAEFLRFEELNSR